VSATGELVRTAAERVASAAADAYAGSAHARIDAAPVAEAPAANARAADLGAGGVDARIAAAWRVLGALEDPELPALTLVDLGIVREVEIGPEGVLRVALSPTYTGCPATQYIHTIVEQALAAADLGEFSVTQKLAPAWSSDWISAEGRRKLEEYGIVPPTRAVSSLRRLDAAPVACPRCRSARTEPVSEFGSTPCKALHRCLDCLEPFERFKCI
jgi:ring-1,2-phenylacetyl-CoA epoxidase subunit PaaD